MKATRVAAITFLVIVSAFCAAADWIAPSSYAHQSRDFPGSAPSVQHLLGTDDLGRDSFARVLYGTRVSLLLAPAAALLSTTIAALTGGIAGLTGRSTKKILMSVTDLFLSLPWLFLLITIRALLPLNTSGELSSALTFLLLGTLGWAAAARVVCSDADSLRSSDWTLLARASGHHGFRLFWIHMLPNLKAVLSAQLWISIPVFILAEANLGMLGLGVSEPLPSWGGLLGELSSFSNSSPHLWKFAPLILLFLVVSSIHLAMPSQEARR